MAHGQGGAEIGFDRGPTLTCNHEAPIAAYGIRTANTSSNGWGIQEEVTHTLDCAQGVAVAHTLRGEGFDANEDGTGMGTPLVPVIGWDDELNTSVEQMGTLLKGGYGGRHEGVMVPLAFDTTQITSAANRSNPMPGDPCHPLAAGAHAPAIAFAIQAGALRTNPESGPDGMGVQAEHAYTLEARAEVQAVAQFIHANKGRPEGRHSAHTEMVSVKPLVETLTTDGHAQSAVFTPAMQVRRLTPTEAERLMGFPDGYTAIPWRKKPASECPDGPRYKALGNSWAVPNVRWIGERIAAAVTQRCA